MDGQPLAHDGPRPRRAGCRNRGDGQSALRGLAPPRARRDRRPGIPRRRPRGRSRACRLRTLRAAPARLSRGERRSGPRAPIGRGARGSRGRPQELAVGSALAHDRADRARGSVPGAADAARARAARGRARRHPRRRALPRGRPEAAILFLGGEEPPLPRPSRRRSSPPRSTARSRNSTRPKTSSSNRAA